MRGNHGRGGQLQNRRPYNKWTAGQQTEALYAVESWYSFHSRDDYSNNIRSIRNSYFNSIDSTVSQYSLYNLVQKINPALNTKIANEIESTKNAILAIPQPFRNNIGDAKVPVAQSACVALGITLTQELKGAIQAAYANGTITYAEMDSVANGFVNKVVLAYLQGLERKEHRPLRCRPELLQQSERRYFRGSLRCLVSRTYSVGAKRSFLFGPVDILGLDPNMDSWPLDQVAIVNILESGNFDDLNWEDGDTEEEITASQEVRGFHTLEFLLFKDGNPRTVAAQ